MAGIVFELKEVKISIYKQIPSCTIFKGVLSYIVMGAFSLIRRSRWFKKRDVWQLCNIHKKDKAWSLFNDDPNHKNLESALYEQEKFEKQQCKSMIKYENKIVANMKVNPKRFFSYLKSKRKINESVTAVKDPHGNLTETPKDTADTIAGFFSSTFTDEPLGPLPKKCYENKNTNVIDEHFCIQEADVKTALMKLDVSKSMGPDMVHPKVLTGLSDNTNFITALTFLYNRCYAEGKIPQIWKTASVTPLHKKGPKTEASNYRPISLTSVLCKIYEKFVRSHIMKFVESKISPKQHGFLSGKSCLSNLLEAVDSINDMLAEGEDVDIFFLDFQKAFDSVPHHRLLIKLQNLGIQGKFLNVIADFLSGRSFNVNVGNAKSNTHQVTSGVPQGSVLGPILFLLYINDLPETIKGKIAMFADDVKMHAKARNYFDNQVDLITLHQWQCLWLLKFNTKDGKCKVMNVGKNNPHNVYLLGDEPLINVKSEVDLGVTINSNWDWSDQINKSISKANASMAWVTRSVICRSPTVLLNIYKSLIRPHLEYCVQLWSPMPRHGIWNQIMDIETVLLSYY